MSTNPSHETPAELDELAGEYVLGTLPAWQRVEVHKRLQHDEQLRAAVHAWEERLLPLTALVEPLPLSPGLWRRVERSLDSLATLTQAKAQHASAASGAGWFGWRSLPFWRGLAGAGFAAAVVLASLLLTQITPPQGPQFVVVLVAPQDKSPGWIVQASNSSEIQLIPLAIAEVPADKALEFWTKADDWSGPVSLGLVKPGQSLQIPLDKLPPLQPNQLFELTLEKSTGSPIGKPTGPVQFIGRAVKVI